MQPVSGGGVTPDFRLCKFFVTNFPKRQPLQTGPAGRIWSSRWGENVDPLARRAVVWRPRPPAAGCCQRGGLLFHQLAGDDDPEGEETDEGGGGGNGNHSGNPRIGGLGRPGELAGRAKLLWAVVSGAGVTPDFRLCKIFIAYYPKKLPPHNNPGGAIRGAVRGAYQRRQGRRRCSEGGAWGVAARRGVQHCRRAAAAVRPAMGLDEGGGVPAVAGGTGPAVAPKPGGLDWRRGAYLRSNFLGNTTQRPKSPMKAAAAMAIIIGGASR